MPETKRSFEEERSLLLRNEECSELSHGNSYPAFKTAIAMGVSNHVGKWPSHLFAAFLAASLVFAIFILFALVTALFCVPTAHYECRSARSVDFAEFPNLYFVKHENRTWLPVELCYVESSIRDYPETKVYLINLLSDVPRKNDSLLVTDKSSEKIANKIEGMIDLLVLLDDSNTSIDTNNLSSNIEDETKIRKGLGARYSNVRNIDVTMAIFFKGSMLANVYNKLDLETLEIAAKANILWNTPGIALDPSDSRYIHDSRRYLCKRGCNLIKNATINDRGSFQASGVPCQAFIGHLLRQVVNNGISLQRDVVKSARDNFCQRLRVCPGLEIYNDSLQFAQPPLSCPTIYPSGIPSTKMTMFTTRGSEFWG